MLQAGRDPCRVGVHPSVTPEPSTTGHPSLSCSPQPPWAVNVNHSRTQRCLQPGLCLFIPFVICCFHKHQLCQEWHVRHPRLLQNLRSNSWYNCGWGKGQYRCVGPWWVKLGAGGCCLLFFCWLWMRVSCPVQPRGGSCSCEDALMVPVLTFSC